MGENLSAPGGSVTLASQTGLLVGGAVDTSGAAGLERQSRRRAAAPADALVSTHGPLTLGGRLRSEGGAGGSARPPQARTAATAAPIEIVVQSIASSTGVLSGGGNGGTRACRTARAAVGGDGGRVRVWAQAPSLILLQLVDSTGGTGTPNGADGPQMDESAPTGLSISKTYTSRVHDARPRRRGLPRVREPRRSAGQARHDDQDQRRPAAEGHALRRGSPTRVAGYHTGVGWQSDPVGPVGFMAPPSATQACTDAPQVTLGVQKLKKKLKALRKKKWHVKIRFLADGMGTAHVVLSRKGKKLVTADKPLGRDAP